MRTEGEVVSDAEYETIAWLTNVGDLERGGHLSVVEIGEWVGVNVNMVTAFACIKVCVRQISVGLNCALGTEKIELVERVFSIVVGIAVGCLAFWLYLAGIFILAMFFSFFLPFF